MKRVDLGGKKDRENCPPGETKKGEGQNDGKKSFGGGEGWEFQTGGWGKSKGKKQERWTSISYTPMGREQ